MTHSTDALKFSCANCSAEFEENFQMPAPVWQVCNRLKTVRCPKCGADARMIRIVTEENPGVLK